MRRWRVKLLEYMKFTVKLPFSEINFENAQDFHKEYFEKLFFIVGDASPKPKYKFTLRFKKIDLLGKDLLFLEEDTSATDGSLFISDTKGNKVKLTPESFSDTSLSIQADPDFDLYYLYNYIIEPLLIIWAARHGILFVHASAILKDGKAKVFAAWRHTGKTSSIFSMVKDKIKFMGDDYCVLFNSKVYIYPKYINIFSYNFESYPWLYGKLSFTLSTRIKLSVYIKKFLYWISQNLSGSLSKVFFRLSEFAEISTNTKVTPQQLDLDVQESAPLDEVIFITKATKSHGKKKMLSAYAIEQKLMAITTYEIRDFLNIYRKFKYLYPDKGNTIIDEYKDNYLKATKANLKKAYETQIISLPNKDAYLNNPLE